MSSSVRAFSALGLSPEQLQEYHARQRADAAESEAARKREVEERKAMEHARPPSGAARERSTRNAQCTYLRTDAEYWEWEASGTRSRDAADRERGATVAAVRMVKLYMQQSAAAKHVARRSIKNARVRPSKKKAIALSGRTRSSRSGSSGGGVALGLSNFKFSKEEQRLAADLGHQPRPDFFEVIWEGGHPPSYQSVATLGGYYDWPVREFMLDNIALIRKQSARLVAARHPPQDGAAAVPAVADAAEVTVAAEAARSASPLPPVDEPQPPHSADAAAAAAAPSPPSRQLTEILLHSTSVHSRSAASMSASTPSATFDSYAAAFLP